MALFGAGFGTLQNITLVLMFERIRARDYGSVSAIWNIAFDAGTGFGAAALGLVAQYAGFGAAFSITSAFVLATLVFVSFEARKKNRDSPEQKT
jgi:predicted MFS family arabinose efflux permease